MTQLVRRFAFFALTAASLSLATGGCSEIGEAIDCHQMCEQLEVCVDSDLNVERCSDRCEDKADENKFAKQLDQCTDCLDRNYSCAEVPEECSACHAISEALLN